MGADGMAASREIILPGQNRIGKQIKNAFKHIENVVSGHRTIQITKLKDPATETETKDTSKEDVKKLIDAGGTSPGSSKEPPKNKKPWIQRKTGILTTGIGLTVLAAAGTGYATYESHQNNIPISRPAENSAVKPPETATPFGKNASEGVINTNTNTISMSIEKIKQEFPEQIVVDETSNTAKTLFPFQPPEGAELKFTTSTYNPKGGAIAPNQDTLIHSPEISFPKGTGVFSPIDGRISLQRDQNDKSKIIGVNLFQYNKEEDTTYIISIGSPRSPSPYWYNLETSVESLNFPPPTTKWETYPTIGRGNKIMTTAQDQPITITVISVKGTEIGAIETGLKTHRIISPEFFTISQNNTLDSGIKELVVMKK